MRTKKAVVSTILGHETSRRTETKTVEFSVIPKAISEASERTISGNVNATAAGVGVGGSVATKKEETTKF